jgi:hypothetical protein
VFAKVNPVNSDGNIGGKTMIQSKLNLWNKVLRRRVYSNLLVAITALTVTMPSIAPALEKELASEEALLVNKPWIGDFDKMAEKRQIRVLVVYSKTFYFLDRGRRAVFPMICSKNLKSMSTKSLKPKR